MISKIKMRKKLWKKIAEIKEMTTKWLGRKSRKQKWANYSQMVLNHSFLLWIILLRSNNYVDHCAYETELRQENLTINDELDGSKKFKKKELGACWAIRWIRPLLLQLSLRKNTPYMVSSLIRKKYHAHDEKKWVQYRRYCTHHGNSSFEQD